MPPMSFDQFWPIVQILLEPFGDFINTLLAVIVFGMIMALFLRRLSS